MERFKLSVINGSTAGLETMLKKLIEDDEQFPGDKRQKEAIEIVKSELENREKQHNALT